MMKPQFSLLDDFLPVDYDQWRAVVDKDLNGAPFDKKLVTHTYEGIQIHPVYTRRDWPAPNAPGDDASGYPGFDPFTRGADALGGSVCGWDIRQEHAHPDLAVTNAAILEDLGRGVTSLQLRLDVAARNGLGPEDDRAGRDGLMIYRAEDFDAALKDVHLQMIAVSLEAGAAFLPAAAAIIALYEQRGHDTKTLRASFNADPIAVFARDGRLPQSLDAAMHQMAELAGWSARHLPRSTAVRVGTGPYHHAGATAAQDLGLSMATAVAYLRVLTDAGMSVDDAAKELLFNFNIGCNVFLAIAKLRAARLLWANVIHAAGGTDEGAGMKMHVRTSKRVITSRDPWVNLLRNTVTGFAAAVGGAQTITTEPFDKALGLPDAFSRRIARNTQLILYEESHLNRVVDPAGGCWFLESLTDDLAEKGWAFFQAIEQQGGMVQALTSGWINDQIDSAFKDRLKNIATRKDAVTGVSEFPNLAERRPQKTTPDLAALRAAAADRIAGREPGDASRIESDMVEAAIAAAKAGDTFAQLFDRLPDTGESPNIAPITPHPYAEPFEQLRDASRDYLHLTGSRPRVFLANMGPVAHHTARATYARNFFEAGGFEVVSNDGFQGEPDEAAAKACEAFDRSWANIAVICSSDKLYPEMVPAVTPLLKQSGARVVILAGHPGDMKAAYDDAGVDRYIFIKCNVLETLRELLREEGVLA